MAGCGPVHLVANTNIPTPLVMKLPITVALFVPQEFSQYVHKEERASPAWRVELGRAQTEGITRLMSAMFERVIPVDSLGAGAALGEQIRAIFEPSMEEFAFVTPRDAGSPFLAVSIKYRVNVYTPDGKLADSWGFTGYGTSPAQGLSSAPPLQAATALAMRDAGAKLAVEFREQAVIRGLLPNEPTPDGLTTAEEAGNAPPSQSPSQAAPQQETPPAEAPAPAEQPAVPDPAASEVTQPGTNEPQPTPAGNEPQAVPDSSPVATPQAERPEAPPRDDPPALETPGEELQRPRAL